MLDKNPTTIPPPANCCGLILLFIISFYIFLCNFALTWDICALNIDVFVPNWLKLKCVMQKSTSQCYIHKNVESVELVNDLWCCIMLKTINNELMIWIDRNYNYSSGEIMANVVRGKWHYDVKTSWGKLANRDKMYRGWKVLFPFYGTEG